MTTVTVKHENLMKIAQALGKIKAIEFNVEFNVKEKMPMTLDDIKKLDGSLKEAIDLIENALFEKREL